MSHLFLRQISTRISSFSTISIVKAKPPRFAFQQISFRQTRKQYLYTTKGTMASLRDGKPVQQWVDDTINSKAVVVFSKTYCPFCDMAKNALKQAGITDYLLIELENREDCGEVQDYLQKVTGGRTVPRVFIHGKFIGGGSEVQQLQAEGKLSAML